MCIVKYNLLCISRVHREVLFGHPFVPFRWWDKSNLEGTLPFKLCLVVAFLTDCCFFLAGAERAAPVSLANL